MPETAVIVVAAGSGTRLAAGMPKAFVPVAGTTMLERALRPIFQSAEPLQVIVVAPAAQRETAARIAREVAGAAASAVTVVAGGQTRQQSVAAGLAVLEPDITTVLVHDAARALAPTELFARVAQAVRRTGNGVVPGLPVVDTIKKVSADGVVQATVDRSELLAVQTPQGFPREALVEAYRVAETEHTDDAALYSAAGHTVETVEGDALAFKVTTPWDLGRAESLLVAPVPQELRTGVGVDVHAYDASEPLWLGGLHWPDEVGLSGHSDGDALSHAVCDALLSAAGLGDIGGLFGTSDARFAGAHGNVFIEQSLALVRGAGFEVANVAVQLIANRPRLGGRRAEMEGYLGTLIGAPVSVAATTSDGLGFTGKGEGVAVIATALLRRIA